MSLRLLLLPVSVIVISCAPYDYDSYKDKKPVTLASPPPHSIDSNGKLKKVTRMKQIKNRRCPGSADVDCGAIIGR